MLPLLIDLDDLVLALTSAGQLEDSTHYLDTLTGEVLYAPEGEEGLPNDLATSRRWRRIEPLAANEAELIAERFVAEVNDAAIQAWLHQALRSPNPLPAFKEALLPFPAQRDAWFRYEQAAHIHLAQAWCASQGIHPTWR